MFNIERASMHDTQNVGQDDVKVRNTILYVLDMFFKEHEDALITICDVNDGKQFARRRLFDSWFRKFNNNRLRKIESECMVGETITSVSLMFSVNIECQEELQSAFLELVNINFYN